MQADAIIAEAKKKAEAIIADAKAEAARTKEASEKEITTLRESAIVSAEQAKRDALLAFKAEVQAAYERILAAKIRDSFTGESLGKLIRAAAEGEDLSAYTAEVAEVSESLTGLTIRPTKGIQAGFRLAANDGSGYFDCSDKEIMEMLMPYFRKLEI